MVEDHFPDAGEATTRATLSSADAAVWYPVVQRVGPQRWVAKRSGHAGIVDEAEFLHHQELTVPADAQERDTNAADVFHGNVGKTVDDVGLADHFIEPIFDRGVGGPPIFRMSMADQKIFPYSFVSDNKMRDKQVNLRDGMGSYFVAAVPQLLDVLVVVVLVADVEGGVDRAPVGILPVFKYLSIGGLLHHVTQCH